MAEQSSRACLLCLIGLPGAGKTTFVRRFKEKKQEEGDVNVIHVCYDDLVPLDEQARLKDEPGQWKEIRSKINQAVEHNIEQLLNSHKNPSEQNAACEQNNEKKDGSTSLSGDKEKESNLCQSSDITDRCDAVQENKFIDQIRALMPSYDCADTEANTNADTNKRTLIVIDDNNYLSSMRYEFYQIARKHSLGFAQLYLHASLQTATELNSGRGVSEVPSCVIERMNENLEPPNPLKNSWEKFSFSVPVSSNTEFNFELVDTVVNTALQYPERPLEDHAEEKDRDRVVCSANLVHQADNHLRSIVNKRMFELKDQNLDKHEMKSSATKFYSIKQEVLEDLKTGFTKLDRSLVESVQTRESGSGDQLLAAVTDLFNEKLNLTQ